MKKALILVNNNFLNDNRVLNISNTFYAAGFKTCVIAAKYYKGLPVCSRDKLNIYRIPLFSSLYSQKPEKNDFIKLNNLQRKNRMINMIKYSKLRLKFVRFLNWFLFNLGTFMLGLIIKPDIIYANDLDTLLVGYLTGKILKKPIIFDSHELWLYGYRYQRSSLIHRRLWQIIQKKLIGKVDAVITTTAMRASILSEQYNLLKVNVIRNCPHYRELEYKNKFREEFPISEDAIILLYQGLIHKRRGIFSIVDAVKDVENVALIFMGMGEDMDNLYDYINENGLNDRIFIKDAVPPQNLLDYTCSADIGLQLLHNVDLNHYSTISNKIFEYIMAGLCIIASDFPEISQIIKKHNLGKVVDPENVAEIRSAIQFYIQDKKLFNAVKANARNTRHLFSWENEEEKLLEIIKKIGL